MLRTARLLLVCATLSTGAAVAQNPVVVFPKNYSIALDNDLVTVIRVHYGPHEHVGVHDHSGFATVYVYLSDSGPVHFIHDEKPPFEQTRPPTVKGNFRVSPGRKERHSVDNLGGQTSDFLRIEFKKISIGENNGLKEFRGKAPAAPLHSGDTVEYTNPKLSLERIICNAGAPCTIEPIASPSLLVALSSFVIKTTGASSESIPDGGIKWLASSDSASITGTSHEPVHLLRIVVNQPKR
ncbi:MAG TPA: hypothetical protein VNU92_06090 [Edaphobacter sp.]|jgi:hypothetical protein|nr:hypothetical protein [Edaphobacter sp.]